MTRRLILTLPALLAARPVKGARLTARREKRDPGQKSIANESGPVLFELTAAERWPIRGLDPVLHIGAVLVDSYRFANAANTVLVFTCFDASRLQEGAPVFLRYGDDESSRNDFPNFAWANVQ